MIQIRKSEARGHFDHGWLKTFHTFSFADYYDPAFMGFRDLRVINEDWVKAGEGFGTHGHRDMEIVTYVLEGELAHKDNMGNGSIIRPGDVQYMSAGKGVLHSEFNHSETETTHILQIWIMPNEKGAIPRYDQKIFGSDRKQGRLCLLASGDGEEGSIQIRQDVRLYASLLDPGQQVEYRLGAGRFGYLQLVRGELEINGQKLGPGDGAALIDEHSLKFSGISGSSEFLFFDLK